MTLEGQLAALAEALERGDTITAVAASEQARALCDAVTAAGQKLDPSALASAQRLYRRCEEGAALLGERIKASLLQSGQSRRAIDSYRSE
jgi:hypothetical protein